jgi:hypothetical protein
MDLLMYPPSCYDIIAFSLDEVFKVVVPYVAIQDLLDLVLLSTINDSGWWWRVISTTWNGVRERYRQLDDRVEVLEVRWESQVIGSMSDTGFNCEWAELLMRQLG